MAAYVTLNDYIREYGEREAILLTNEDAETTSPTYDSQRIGDELEDQSDFADGYIGRKYAIPLADPPKVVQSIVKALTREALYTHNVPEEVKDAANRARQQLKDISSGAMVLPVPAGGDPAVETGSADSSSSLDRELPTFGRIKQADYMAPFNPGRAGACWRNGQ